MALEVCFEFLIFTLFKSCFYLVKKMKNLALSAAAFKTFSKLNLEKLTSEKANAFYCPTFIHYLAYGFDLNQSAS
jgi:hypothetical protein